MKWSTQAEDDDMPSLPFPPIMWERGKGRVVVLVKGRSGVFFFFSSGDVGAVPA